jgi:hypothetical protein
MPASKASQIKRIACWLVGRLTVDSGIAPKPIGLTEIPDKPNLRFFIGNISTLSLLFVYIAIFSFLDGFLLVVYKYINFQPLPA